ncbi:hypothetical protein B0A75_02150 [Flavobacterium oncorhynchi]|uniref:Uncharacterized protein n=1 Tax=Flavobacterium oncorhynchi TaxID=728056 RepID=A0A226IBV0_9FLAO|nr:hypothetical protein B0A75_02150 [Flavobacterium oncorhynchi]
MYAIYFIFYKSHLSIFKIRKKTKVYKSQFLLKLKIKSKKQVHCVIITHLMIDCEKQSKKERERTAFIPLIVLISENKI